MRHAWPRVLTLIDEIDSVSLDEAEASAASDGPVFERSEQESFVVERPAIESELEPLVLERRRRPRREMGPRVRRLLDQLSARLAARAAAANE